MRRNRTWRRRPPHSVLVVDSGATSFYVIVTYILVHVQFYIDVGGAERGADDASSSECESTSVRASPRGAGCGGRRVRKQATTVKTLDIVRRLDIVNLPPTSRAAGATARRELVSCAGGRGKPLQCMPYMSMPSHNAYCTCQIGQNM
jgi:hypothetical protein